MKDWKDLPANAQTIRTVESCIDRLNDNCPYPPNMNPDRSQFAAARLGYQAAIYEMEKFMCELTEEIELDNIDLIKE